MYQQVINSESIDDLISECKPYLRLLNYDVEDSVIGRQLIVAINKAEQICNRAFSVKNVEVKSSSSPFPLLGIVDVSKTITVKVDDVETTNYTISGHVNPSITVYESGSTYTVTYYTVGAMPDMVKEWVFQYVNKLFNRNSPDATEPDSSLLEPYKNLVWLA